MLTQLKYIKVCDACLVMLKLNQTKWLTNLTKKFAALNARSCVEVSRKPKTWNIGSNFFGKKKLWIYWYVAPTLKVLCDHRVLYSMQILTKTRRLLTFMYMCNSCWINYGCNSTLSRILGYLSSMWWGFLALACSSLSFIAS